ncbi:MAG TPA: hypothetical protein PLL10_06610, partial [Elusimicrobiales bacterium]|nr:hypothetical protein [Elusimicrobiales bacterium]
MTAFICLLGLGLLIYVYRLFSSLGGGGGGFLSNTGPEQRLATAHWAVPLAFLSGWFLKESSLLVLLFPLRVLCHEVGHSLLAWLGGCWSFPSISGHAITDPDKSVLVSLMTAAAIAWLIWQGIKIRNWLLIGCCATLLSGFVFFHFVAGKEQLQEWILFSGHGGE